MRADFGALNYSSEIRTCRTGEDFLVLFRGTVREIMKKFVYRLCLDSTVFHRIRREYSEGTEIKFVYFRRFCNPSQDVLIFLEHYKYFTNYEYSIRNTRKCLCPFYVAVENVTPSPFQK